MALSGELIFTKLEFHIAKQRNGPITMLEALPMKRSGFLRQLQTRLAIQWI